MIKNQSSVGIRWEWIDRGPWGIPAPFPPLKASRVIHINEILNIEDAKKYYLVPMKDQESLYWVGNKKRLLSLEMVMDAKSVIATAGINTETCYIMVDMTGDECKELLNKAKEVRRKGADADKQIKPKKD